ncbi:hypothetical protein FSOLCH5_009676 [Fusarium solani]
MASKIQNTYSHPGLVAMSGNHRLHAPLIRRILGPLPVADYPRLARLCPTFFSTLVITVGDRQDRHKYRDIEKCLCVCILTMAEKGKTTENHADEHTITIFLLTSCSSRSFSLPSSPSSS